MRQAPEKKILRSTPTELRRQEQLGIARSNNSFTSQGRSRIYSFLPSQLRWLMPLVREDIREAIKNRQDRGLELEDLRHQKERSRNYGRK